MEKQGFGPGSVVVVASLSLLAGCLLGYGLSLLWRAYFEVEQVVTPSVTQENNQASTLGGDGITNLTPIDSPTPTLSPTLEVSVSQQTSGNIPGLFFVDVTVKLKDRGFECGDFQKINTLYAWNCVRDEPGVYISVVDVYSRTLETVDFIDANVNQFGEPSSDIAATILGLVATVPYSGSEPERARAWVETALPTIRGEAGESQMQVIGGVQFVLFGPPSARTLDIGEAVIP